jgi:DNA repair protein REV1
LKQFLGHGVCETFNRTVTLADPKSTATNDPDVIGEQAWRALKSLHFDSTELRGLGLQVTKLEDIEDGPESQSGQTTLHFVSKTVRGRDPLGAGTSKATDVGDEDTVEYVPPTADEIDLSVLGELPEEIRRELEGDMKQCQAENLGVDPAGPVEQQEDEDDEVVILEDHTTTEDTSLDPNPPVTPKKTAITTPNVSHITRQLRPKTRTIISPAKTSLFAKREQKTPQVATEELKELGIDTAVFSALPADVQREQLNMLRAGAFQTQLEAGHVGGDAGLRVGLGHGLERAHSIESGRGFTRSPSVDTVRGPAGPLVAKFAVAPAIVHKKQSTGGTRAGMGTGQNSRDGMLVRMTEATEVQAHVKRWVVEGYKAGVAPPDADVKGLEAWTVGCVNMHGTIVGVEKVVQVMRWWRALLRQYWAAEEQLKEMPDGSRTIGILWWSAFWDVKAAIDAVLKEKKFGGRLSLR